MSANPVMAAIRRHSTLVILTVGLLLLVGLFELIGDRSLSRTVTEALIRVVVVVGMYIFIGNSGVLSFGHIGFMAIGAYATAWQTCCPRLKPLNLRGLPDFLLDNTFPVLPASIASGLLTAVVALIIGVALMRLSGIAASIGTFAFLAIVNVVYSNWDSVTGGTGSVVGIPVYVNMWVALAWAAIAILTAYLYQRSRFGLALRASREDEVAARAAGVNIFRQRLFAYVISAFFLGIGGVLHGHWLGIINPDEFYLVLTFLTLAMLVVGGINSLSGAVVGVVVISALIEILRQFESGVTIAGVEMSLPSGVQEIALGVLMLLILIFRNSGIMGNKEITWPWKNGAVAPAKNGAVAPANDKTS